jgi:hypothetical protein
MSGLRPPAGAICAPLRFARAAFALAPLVCCTLCAGAALQAPGALAAPGAPSLGGFSAVPETFSASEPITRSYFRPHIAAGGSVREEALLRNSSAHSMTILIYPVEGLTGSTSGAVYSSRGAALHGPGRWVTPAIAELTLAPGKQRRLPFTVRVPRGTQPGDHLAGIAFQNATPTRSRGRFSITEIVRIVIGIEVIVPGPAAAQIVLEGAALGPLGGTGRPAVIMKLRNSGRLLCAPRLRVALRGPEGQLSAPVSRQLEAILPGDAIPYPLPWNRPLGAGSYGVVASASGCGHPAAISTPASLSGPLGGGANAPFAATARASIAWALIAAGCGAAAALALLLLLALRRRERKRVAVLDVSNGRWE